MTIEPTYNFKCKDCKKKMQFSRFNNSQYCTKCRQKRKVKGQALSFVAAPLKWETSTWPKSKKSV